MANVSTATDEAEKLEKLIFSGDSKNALLGVSLASARTSGAGAPVVLALLLAVAIFSGDDDVRKRAREALQGTEAATIGRNAGSIRVATKLTKVLDEAATAGVDPSVFSRGILRSFLLRSATDGRPWEWEEPALEALSAALPHHRGDEPRLFADLVGSRPALTFMHVTLRLDGELPPGLHALTDLRSLTIEGTLKRGANIAELLEIPQKIFLYLDVRTPDLGLFRAAAANLGGFRIYGRKTFRSLADLAHFPALEAVDVHRTGVSDLRPLAALKGLRTLNVRETAVTDLSPILGLEHLEQVDFSELPLSAPLDLTPMVAWKNLTQIQLFGTPVDAPSLARLRTERPSVNVLA